MKAKGVEPLAKALAKAVTPASPILLSLSKSAFNCASEPLAQLCDLYLHANSISDKAKGTMQTAMSKRKGNVHL